MSMFKVVTAVHWIFYMFYMTTPHIIYGRALVLLQHLNLLHL